MRYPRESRSNAAGRGAAFYYDLCTAISAVGIGREHRDLERVALAREVIGPDAELYVDANGGYPAGQAVRIAGPLAPYGVTWFEEPVSSQDLAGQAAVRRQVEPDVAAGEYSWSLADRPLSRRRRGGLPSA